MASPNRYRLLTCLAERDGHVAGLIHRVAELDDVVGLVDFESRPDQPPRPLAEPDPELDVPLVALLEREQVALPSLWDTRQQVMATGDVVATVERLAELGGIGIASQSRDDRGHSDAEWVREAIYGPLDALERIGLTASVAGTPEAEAVQRAYERAVVTLFDGLQGCEARLSRQRFLLGDLVPGLADWWLFCALVRFEPVYYGLLKCSLKRLTDFPNLTSYLRDLYALRRVAETVDVARIKRHYFGKSEVLNPRRLLPVGGDLDLTLPHERAYRFDPDCDRAREVGVEEDEKADHAPGEFVRGRSGHRGWVTANGSSGLSAEPGRYHLYVANNCPWCHRVILTRALKGLERVITMDTLFYRRHPQHGWQFNPDEPGCTPDTVNGVRYIVELYERVGSSESSLPVLWDRQTEAIVSNESAEIIRMLNRSFEPWSTTDLDLVPEDRRAEIDGLNAWIYQDINNGAYKAGFAESQPAYEEAYHRFFAALERLDEIFSTRRYLCGDALTEADVRLFPTLFRFDPVYYVRFRLNQRRLRELAHVQRWLDEMLGRPEVAWASNIEHCKRGYFGRTGNNIVPLGL